MFYIPAEFYPIIGFLFVLTFCGLGTILLNLFRKKEISVDISTTMSDEATASNHSVAKHG